MSKKTKKYTLFLLLVTDFFVILHPDGYYGQL